MFRASIPILLLALIPLTGGCETPGEPVNTEAFRTPEQVVEERRARQRQQWQELAVSLVPEERPGATATATATAEGDFAVTVEADGVRHVIDLAPAGDLLAAQPDRATRTLREHLRRALPAFDQARLGRLSFEEARPRIRPMLVGGAALLRMQSALGEAAPAATNVGGGLYWVPSLRWGQGAATPLGPKVAEAWGVEQAELSKVALANAGMGLSGGDALFETVSFGPLGRIGQLRPTVEASAILSPAFLEAVRRHWKTGKDLAVLVAGERDVRFLEADQTKLLDTLWPHWSHQVATSAEALATRPLLLSESGLTLMNYTPPLSSYGGATRPATPGAPGPAAGRPPGAATRPAIPRPTGKPYIAR